MKGLLTTIFDSLSPSALVVGTVAMAGGFSSSTTFGCCVDIMESVVVATPSCNGVACVVFVSLSTMCCFARLYTKCTELNNIKLTTLTIQLTN